MRKMPATMSAIPKRTASTTTVAEGHTTAMMPSTMPMIDVTIMAVRIELINSSGICFAYGAKVMRLPYPRSGRCDGIQTQLSESALLEGAVPCTRLCPSKSDSCQKPAHFSPQTAQQRRPTTAS
ncbi:Uncharacterised protein [Mycobacteroides abscessus subsp. abscessus]|nr:Uncharacterised protein [Mycobacteroides abscessus subsp. abscessus]